MAKWLVAVILLLSSVADARSLPRVTAPARAAVVIHAAHETIERCIDKLPAGDVWIAVRVDPQHHAHVGLLPADTAPWRCVRDTIERLAFAAISNDAFNLRVAWQEATLVIDNVSVVTDVLDGRAGVFEDCVPPWTDVHVELDIAYSGHATITSDNTCVAAKRLAFAWGHPNKFSFDLRWQAVAIAGAVGSSTGPGGAQDPRPRGPRAALAFGTSEALDDSTLSADLVVAKIRAAYVAGVRRCYQHHVDQDPTAHGTLTLAFTVEATGRLTIPNVTSFAADIEGCVAGAMAAWRFPVPKNKNGDASDARYRITLELAVN
jgi:hypothetical protein